MNLAALQLPAVAVIGVTAAVILSAQNWRWRVGALGLQYLAMYMLISQFWPRDLAVVKLVAGWMAASVLGLSRLNSTALQEQRRWPAERIFRLLAGGMVVMAAGSLTASVGELLPNVTPLQVGCSLYLIGMGLLTIGFSSRPFPMILALLTMLTGFEILYAAVEISTLVTGLQAAITLGIALVGSYLLDQSGSEAEAVE